MESEGFIEASGRTELLSGLLSGIFPAPKLLVQKTKSRCKEESLSLSLSF